MTASPPGPFARGWSRVRTLADSVLREHASPGRLAAAVALGALVGSSPLVGLHAVIALALASVARLNRVAAFAGSNVSIGPLMPLLLAAELAVGAKLLGIADAQALPTSLAQAFSVTARVIWTGWLVVGTASAMTLGGLTFWAARARDRRAGTRASAPPDPPASA